MVTPPSLNFSQFILPLSPFIGNSFPHHPSEQIIQPVLGIPGTSPLVQPKGELVNVQGAVLLAPVVIDPIVASLYYRPYRFDPVGVGHAVDVLPRGVLHLPMLVFQPM